MRKLFTILLLLSCLSCTTPYKQFQVVQGEATILTDPRTGRQVGVFHEREAPYRKWYVEYDQIKKYKDR